ncbi:hypothetical protein OC861_006917, partial [Tilletia horrida]
MRDHLRISEQIWNDVALKTVSDIQADALEPDPTTETNNGSTSVAPKWHSRLKMKRVQDSNRTSKVSQGPIILSTVATVETTEQTESTGPSQAEAETAENPTASISSNSAESRLPEATGHSDLGIELDAEKEDFETGSVITRASAEADTGLVPAEVRSVSRLREPVWRSPKPQGTPKRGSGVSQPKRIGQHQAKLDDFKWLDVYTTILNIVASAPYQPQKLAAMAVSIMLGPIEEQPEAIDNSGPEATIDVSQDERGNELESASERAFSVAQMATHSHLHKAWTEVLAWVTFTCANRRAVSKSKTNEELLLSKFRPSDQSTHTHAHKVQSAVRWIRIAHALGDLAFLPLMMLMGPDALSLDRMRLLNDQQVGALLQFLQTGSDGRNEEEILSDHALFRSAARFAADFVIPLTLHHMMELLSGLKQGSETSNLSRKFELHEEDHNSSLVGSEPHSSTSSHVRQPGPFKIVLKLHGGLGVSTPPNAILLPNFKTLLATAPNQDRSKINWLAPLSVYGRFVTAQPHSFSHFKLLGKSYGLVMLADSEASLQLRQKYFDLGSSDVTPPVLGLAESLQAIQEATSIEKMQFLRQKDYDPARMTEAQAAARRISARRPRQPSPAGSGEADHAPNPSSAADEDNALVPPRTFTELVDDLTDVHFGSMHSGPGSPSKAPEDDSPESSDEDEDASPSKQALQYLQIKREQALEQKLAEEEAQQPKQVICINLTQLGDEDDAHCILRVSDDESGTQGLPESEECSKSRSLFYGIYGEDPHLPEILSWCSLPCSERESCDELEALRRATLGWIHCKFQQTEACLQDHPEALKWYQLHQRTHQQAEMRAKQMAGIPSNSTSTSSSNRSYLQVFYQKTQQEIARAVDRYVEARPEEHMNSSDELRQAKDLAQTQLVHLWIKVHQQAGTTQTRDMPPGWQDHYVRTLTPRQNVGGSREHTTLETSQEA